MRRLASTLAVAPALFAFSLLLTGCDDGSGPSVPKGGATEPAGTALPEGSKATIKGGKAVTNAASSNTNAKAE